jgi:hypothetical protein
MSTVFQASFILVAPFWFLMVFLPHWQWSKRIINSPFIIAPAALLYAILVLPLIGDVLPAVMNPTLDGVAALLASEAGATIGWVHFLAFDLFVGRWAYLDSQKRGISAWLMAPILYFTLMLGPIGFLLYLLVRAGHERVSG